MPLDVINSLVDEPLMVYKKGGTLFTRLLT